MLLLIFNEKQERERLRYERCINVICPCLDEDVSQEKERKWKVGRMLQKHADVYERDVTSFRYSPVQWWIVLFLKGLSGTFGLVKDLASFFCKALGGSSHFQKSYPCFAAVGERFWYQFVEKKSLVKAYYRRFLQQTTENSNFKNGESRPRAIQK